VKRSAINANGNAMLLDAPAAPRQRSAFFGLLIGGTLLAMLAVFALASPDPDWLADAELARLMRYMAVVKFAFVVIAAGLLYWRFARVIARPMLASYLGGTWMMAVACVLIFELTAIPLAAAVFHAGGLALLVAACLDQRDGATMAD
jgi:hypothetical protein